MTRVLVCGGRAYDDVGNLWRVLDSYDNDRDFTVLIEGAASGADTLARQWAEAKKITVKSYPADWKRYGKAAGPARNLRMLEEGKPELVIAFAGGKGTANMVAMAKAAGVEVVEVSP